MSLDDFQNFLDEDPDKEKDGPSNLDLDRLAAGQLPREIARPLEAEAMADPDRANELKRRRLGTDAIDWVDTDALLGRIKAQVGEVDTEPRPSIWARLFSGQGIGFGLLAAGAAAAMVFLVLDPSEPGVGPLDPVGVRVKGALRLKVFRQKGSGAELMASGAAFRAGDTLQFKVDAPGPGTIRVFGVDAKAALYTAWPLPEHSGSADQIQGPVKDQALPGAVELDDAPGAEILYLVHCPPGIEARCTAGAPIRCPEGCSSTPFTIEKTP